MKKAKSHAIRHFLLVEFFHCISAPTFEPYFSKGQGNLAKGVK